MSGVSAGPVTIVVSPDGSSGHRSIAAAFAAAPDGATIVVHAGNYAESLVITRPVTIAAAEPTGAVVVEPPNGAAVTMSAGSATLRQLTLSGRDPAMAVIHVAGGS